MERPLFLILDPMKPFEFTCQGTQEVEVKQEPGVKQERDTAETEDNEKIDKPNNGTSIDEGNIPIKEIKYEVTSDDHNDNTQVSNNIESHNLPVLSTPQCINVYDEMIDFENGVKLDLKMSDNIGDKIGPSTWNDVKEEELLDEDIPLRRSSSSKGVKLNEDTKKTENNEKIDKPNNGTSVDEGNIPIKEIKYEVTSDDHNDNTQVSNNIESHNFPVLSNPQCINVYDEMIDFENDVKLDLKMSDNIGDKIGPSAWNDVKEEELLDEDIPLRRSSSSKEVKLNEDTESSSILKEQRLITLEHRHGNTDPAVVLHNEGHKFSCHQCSCKTTNKHHQFSCDECKCKYKQNLKQHLLKHTGEKPFACNKCDFKLSRSNSAKRHSLSHTDEKAFICDKCDYKCKMKRSLKRHLLTHTDEKPFSCDKCDFKCIDNKSLKRHLLTHTDENPFSCDKCDFKCKCTQSLKQHLLKHTGEKPFSCDKCDFKCSDNKSLKRHLLTHTDEKPFFCDKCEYKCKIKCSLNRHSLTHTGKKMFSCDECGYKCIYKHNLKQHLLKHSGKKLFSCDKCVFKCNYKQGLKQHLLKHTREKSISCDKCDFKCKYKRSLKQHLLKHTREKTISRDNYNRKRDSLATPKMISCSKCDYKCTYKREALRHLLTHMSEENEILLRNAKEKLGNIYKYIWFQNGKVLARKSDTDQAVPITSDKDIVTLITKL